MKNANLKINAICKWFKGASHFLKHNDIKTEHNLCNTYQLVAAQWQLLYNNAWLNIHVTLLIFKQTRSMCICIHIMQYPCPSNNDTVPSAWMNIRRNWWWPYTCNSLACNVKIIVSNSYVHSVMIYISLVIISKCSTISPSTRIVRFVPHIQMNFQWGVSILLLVY